MAEICYVAEAKTERRSKDGTLIGVVGTRYGHGNSEDSARNDLQVEISFYKEKIISDVSCSLIEVGEQNILGVRDIDKAVEAAKIEQRNIDADLVVAAAMKSSSCFDGELLDLADRIRKGASKE